jgi:hypothetical protein
LIGRQKIPNATKKNILGYVVAILLVFFTKRKEKKRKEANQQVNEIMEHAC